MAGSHLESADLAANIAGDGDGDGGDTSPLQVARKCVLVVEGMQPLHARDLARVRNKALCSEPDRASASDTRAVLEGFVLAPKAPYSTHHML